MIKLHVGEFSDQGGVRLAAEFGPVSVDHLDHIRADEVSLLAESGAVGVLLPGVSHFLKATHLPPARELLAQAHEEHWLLIFQHDPKIRMGYLKKKEGRYQLEEVRVA